MELKLSCEITVSLSVVIFQFRLKKAFTLPPSRYDNESPRNATGGHQSNNYTNLVAMHLFVLIASSYPEEVPYFWEAILPENNHDCYWWYLLNYQGPSPRNHQISTTTSSSENREYSHFWMGGGLDKEREGQGRGSIHKCKHDEGRKLYAVSRVDPVNCNEACGYSVPINSWMGYSYQTTK